MFAYVTVGGLNEVKVFRTSDFQQVATIEVGKLPRNPGPTRLSAGPSGCPRSAAFEQAPDLKNFEPLE